MERGVSGEPWRAHLAALSRELESQSALLHKLQMQNVQLESALAAVGQSRQDPAHSLGLQGPQAFWAADVSVDLPGEAGGTLPAQWVPATARRMKSLSVALGNAGAKIAGHAEPQGDMSQNSQMSTVSELSAPSQVACQGPRSPSPSLPLPVKAVTRLIEEGGIKFTVLRAQEDTIQTVQKPWYIINPDRSRLASIWQIIMGIALLFVALVSPVQVALLKPKLDFLFALGLVVDVLFFVDFVLQFFTAYPKTTPHGVVLEVRLSSICCRYMKTFLLVDLATMIPFDLLAVTMQDLEAPVSIPYQKIALVKFMFILLFICHWLACGWAVTLSAVDAYYPRWIDEIQEADAAYGIVTTDSPFRIYIAAFYFCSYTITSVGYGDISPQNILERGVCCGILLTAGLSWAYIIGEVGTIVADMTVEGQEFRKTMHHLNKMMRDQRLPRSLQNRVRRYFLQNRSQSLFVARQTLMRRMSPQLQAEVSVMTNMMWLKKVSFFKSFLAFIEMQSRLGEHTAPFEACVADVARCLNLAAFAQQETFHNVQVLYILSKGLVALNSRIGGLGEVWGEDFVLSDTSLIRPVAGYALTYVELLSLAREDFMQVIQRRRITCPELFRLVRRYCVRVAVYRGILAEARRRQIAALNEGLAQQGQSPDARVALPGKVQGMRPPKAKLALLGSLSSLSLPGMIES